jgi:hypothetical protein
MTYRMKAVYRGGTFVLETRCELPENAEVDLLVQGPLRTASTVTNPEKRASVLRRITDRMRQNPIPANAPRFTRYELHERAWYQRY